MWALCSNVAYLLNFSRMFSLYLKETQAVIISLMKTGVANFNNAPKMLRQSRRLEIIADK